MHNVRKIKDDIFYLGGNDRRLSLFENHYPIPRGVSYNSYLVMDEKTVLLDTVDAAIADLFFDNIAHVLGDRKLDYIIVDHMEPDHSATLGRLLEVYPDVQVICNTKTINMINQFFTIDISDRLTLVKEGDTLNTGKHEFTLVPLQM